MDTSLEKVMFTDPKIRLEEGKGIHRERDLFLLHPDIDGDQQKRQTFTGDEPQPYPGRSQKTTEDKGKTRRDSEQGECVNDKRKGRSRENTI